MLDYINDCVGCEHCGHCGRDHLPVTRCDECGEICDEVAYTYHGKELCRGCTDEVCDAWFKDLPLVDMMQLFGWDLDEFSTREGAEAEACVFWDGLSIEEKIWYVNNEEKVIEEVDR